MIIPRRLILTPLLLVMTAAAVPAIGVASTVTLNGSGAMTYTYQFLWSNPSSPAISNDYDLAVPGQYTFSDSFLSQQPTSSNLGTSSVGAYDFQDSYRFTVGSGANGDTLVASLGLGNTFNIANMQFRLYEVPTSTTAPIVGGIPSGSTLITAWMGPPAGSNEVQASFSGIQAGTYILDVAGIADGADGGTYIGQVNLNPVPLPGSLPLALSGLAGLWAVSRGRGAGSLIYPSRTHMWS